MDASFAGPVTVTFANGRPTVEKDGKVSTTATFSAPGEYIVARAGQRSLGRRRRRVPVLLDQRAREGHHHRRRGHQVIATLCAQRWTSGPRSSIVALGHADDLTPTIDLNVSVLLLSTYDLGRQPLGWRLRPRWLRHAGFTVATCDLSRAIAWMRRRSSAASMVAIYLPDAHRDASGASRDRSRPRAESGRDDRAPTASTRL